MLPDNDTLIEMYRRMLRIRYFDQAMITLHARGEFAGAAHASIGQEGEIVGSCMALRPDDYMVGNHRSHGHPIGKGAELRPLMAELMGRVTGVNRGKGGSMHLADFSVGSVGETSIVASGIPVAAGAALGSQMLGLDRVSLCFFGDGAANAGPFHEGLNLAAIWKLPVVYICENNLYASSTRIDTVTTIDDIAVRATSYDIPGLIVDGQDAIAVYDVVRDAVSRARRGEGPTLIEAKTYRYEPHGAGVFFVPERPDEEMDSWIERDPLTIHAKLLLAEGIQSEGELDKIQTAIQDEVDDAVDFGLSSPFPTEQELYQHLFYSPD